MTTVPDPDNPDTEGATLPPYEGRREAADPSEESGTTPDAETKGASAPTDDAEMTSPEPDETPGGATASPADEQPAQGESDDPDEGPGATGPAHTSGTGRAEDKP